MEVLEPSPLEVCAPLCKNFPACGGCMYQTMSYESQLEMKAAQVKSLMDEAIVAGVNIRSDEVLSKHADWVDELKKRYTFTADNAVDIILQETGKVFVAVLEDAGVYKNTKEGKNAFLRYISYVNQQL